MPPRLNLEIVRSRAKTLGFDCLSEVYLGNHVKLRWRCQANHVWEAEPNSLFSAKSGCPRCKGHARLTLQDARDVALPRGGECLSASLTNGREKLEWKCLQGHVWRASLSAVRGGTWCPTCARNKPIDSRDLTDIASQKGGMCFMVEGRRVECRCNQGHTWLSSPTLLKRGIWCRLCSKVSKQDRLRALACERGGALLSSEGMPRWRCASGHEWAARYTAAKWVWCPQCISPEGPSVPWSVYALEDPAGGGIRYVGVTHQKPHQRLMGHVRGSRHCRSHVQAWIQNVLNQGRRPNIQVLESGVGSGWAEAERKWIRFYREDGSRLTNLTDGGDGSVGVGLSSRARARLAEFRRGKPLSAETKARISATKKGRTLTEEHKAKIAAAGRGRVLSPETRAKISAKYKRDPETIAKRVTAAQRTRARQGTYAS